MKDLQAKVETIEKKLDVYVEFYGWSSEEAKNLRSQLDQINLAILDLMLLEQEIERMDAIVA
jgi:hypothetical protein